MAKFQAWFSCLALAIMVYESSAQDVSCLNQLVPCLNYLSSNKNPSGDCCDPLKSIIDKNPQCICSNLNSNVSPGQNAINVTEVLLLPSKCGLHADASICSTNSPYKRTPLAGTSTKKDNDPSSAGKILFTHVVMVIMPMTVHFIWASQNILG